MAKRAAVTRDRAEKLRIATAESVMAHLRVAGVNVPSSCLALGLATALSTMLGHVDARHRAKVVDQCRAILNSAEGRTR